ncbi:MAG: pilus assembly PilX N-terminal domain-containing protein [Oleibacter sp.]|nr:pilus assembly PilX N-terminal domain-containing protein [Thalassolituus sp.]
MHQPNCNSQRGIALITSLVLLTSVTYLAILGLQGSTLQAKMVTNTQLQSNAFIVSQSELEAHYALSRTQEGLSLFDQAMSDLKRNESNEIEYDGEGNVEFQPIGSNLQDSRGGDYLSMKIDSTEITTEITSLSKGAIVRNAFSGDSSIGQFSTEAFNINTVTNASADISSSQSVGITLIVPVTN